MRTTQPLFACESFPRSCKITGVLPVKSRWKLEDGNVCVTSGPVFHADAPTTALNARAAFMWRRTNGRQDEQRPRWALHPSTQRPIERHIRLIIKFPVVSEQTERGVSQLRALGLITFLLHLVQPQLGPPSSPSGCSWPQRPPPHPTTPPSLRAAHTIPTYLMTAVLFLPELHRESFLVAQEFLWTRNRRLGYKTWGRCEPNCFPTPAADAGRRSIGF